MYKRIKELCDSRGILTFYQLSQETGISESVFSRLRSGERQKLSSKNLEILANYFRVDRYWLQSGMGDAHVEDDRSNLKSNSKENCTDRLKYYLKKTGIQQGEFLARLGKSRNYLNSINSFSHETLLAIKELLPDLDTDWLQFGGSDMSSSLPVVGNIRYWQDIEATGGGVTLYEDSDSNAYTWMNIPGFADCTDAVMLRGDSMYPTLRSGQIILLQRWTESFIEYGNIYLIITKSGNRMVKYIRKCADDAHIICASENKEYDDIDVRRDDVLALYRVRGGVQMF